MSAIPPSILNQVQLADTAWQPILIKALDNLQRQYPDYLHQLAADQYLPTQQRLFAAFQQPLNKVRFILIGEGPYPREESATGVCFMDGAVKELWSDKGLSKTANRATSLRNFIKMLLVADNKLSSTHTSGDALAPIAHEALSAQSIWINNCAQLQRNLFDQGFLLLNASLVFRHHVKPAQDTKAWKPFFDTILLTIAEEVKKNNMPNPTFILWGKLAEQLKEFCANHQFHTAISEHPYNLSFIQNNTMQEIFKPMHLLYK